MHIVEGKPCSRPATATSITVQRKQVYIYLTFLFLGPLVTSQGSKASHGWEGFTAVTLDGTRCLSPTTCYTSSNYDREYPVLSQARKE